MMRPWTNIILAAMALAQAAYLLAGLAGQGSEVEKNQERRLFPGFASERVQWISLQNFGYPPVKIVRSPKGWQITQPMEERAYQGAMEEILSAVEFADYVRILPPADDRRQLGLQTPRLILKIGLPETTLALSIGEDDPIQRGTYVALTNKRFVVEHAFYEVLNKRVDDLRERELWPYGSDQIQRVTWGDLTLTREGARWMIKTPILTAHASPSEVQRILSAVSGLRATRFVPRPNSALSHQTISVTGRKHRLEVQLGGDCPGRPTEMLLAHKRHSWQYLCVDREDLRILQWKAIDLIDPILTRVGEADAQKVHLQGPSQDLVFFRAGGDWQIKPDLRLDDQRIRLWFEQLGGARAVIEPLDPLQVEKLRAHPELTVTIEGRSGRRESFIVGRPIDDQIPVVREGENTLLWYPPSVGALLKWGPPELRSRRILDFSPLDVQRITTRRGQEQEVLSRQDGVWLVLEPVKIKGDEVHIKEVLHRLSSLRVSHFLENEAFQSRLRLSILIRPEELKQGTPEAEGKMIELELGPGNTGEPCHGRMVGVPSFVLQAEDCVLLYQRRANHELLEINEEEIRTVVVTSAARRLEANKRGYLWTDAQDRPISAARIAQLIGLLKGFRSERVISYSTPRFTPSLRVEIGQARGPRQEIMVSDEGRAVVVGRPISYGITPALISTINIFLDEP